MGSPGEVLPPFAQNRVVYHNTNARNQGPSEFSIVQYNVLHDCSKSSLQYWYCPDEYFLRKEQENSYRHKLLLDELQWLNSDVMCLQEVDLWQFGCLKEALHQRGYSGEFAAFSGDHMHHQGNAVFYRSDKFKLVNTKKYELGAMIGETFGCERFNVPPKVHNWSQVFQVVALQFRDTDQYLVIGNIHILWGQLLHPISQAVQVAIVTQAFDGFIKSVKEHVGVGKVGYVLSGDFNIEPHYPLYHLLSEGKLDDEQMSKIQTVDYIKWSSLTRQPPKVLLAEEQTLLKATKDYLTNPLTTLKSVYKCIMGKEPEISNYEGNDNFWTLDYIWFSSESLQPNSVLSLVPKSDIDPFGGLPNEGFPSDHLSLKATFQFID